MRYLAPFLVAIVAAFAANIAQLVSIAVLAAVFTGARPVAAWMITSEAAKRVLSVIEPASFFLSSAFAVALVTRALVRRERFHLRWPVEHLVHCVILYTLVLVGVYARVGEVHEHHLLIQAVTPFWLLFAAGGISGNCWTLRRAAIGNP